MTREEEQEFLNLIESTIEKYPYLLEKVLIASSHAMYRSIVNLERQVADMETIAIAFSSMAKEKKRTNYGLQILLSQNLRNIKIAHIWIGQQT